MSKISCDMCMDLMPLVQDGVASEDSRRAVALHIQDCPDCAGLFDGELPPPSDARKILEKIQRKVRTFLAMLLMFGVFYGLNLTAGSGIFQNAVIMPAIGAIGYYLFRWHGLYLIPVTLLLTHFATNAMGLGAEYLMLPALLLWTGIYCAAALVGFAIAALLHLFLQKGGTVKKKILKTAALVVGLGLICGIAVFANSLMGNPVSRMLAERAAEAYLAEQFPQTDYYVERVGFNFKTPDYYAHIRSDSSVDTQFTLYIDYWGNVRYDTYDSVLSGWNTHQRLDQEYRELVRQVTNSPAFPYSCDIDYGELQIHRIQDIQNPNITDIPDYALAQEDLILDKTYDIRELGAQAGQLVIYVDSDTVSMEKAAEVLLTIREEFDKAAVPFGGINFTLQYPKPLEGQRQEGNIEIRHFSYDEIYAENLAERIQAADEALKAYYAELDAKGVK